MPQNKIIAGNYITVVFMYVLIAKNRVQKGTHQSKSYSAAHSSYCYGQIYPYPRCFPICYVLVCTTWQ